MPASDGRLAVELDDCWLTVLSWVPGRPLTAQAGTEQQASPAAMSWGLLHGDPAPGAFRLDPAAGRCGIIDWSYFLYGPPLYDLASAAMYVGGVAQAGDLIEAYLAEGMLPAAEAWRISRNDLTGIAGPQENEKGLEDARLALLGRR